MPVLIFGLQSLRSLRFYPNRFYDKAQSDVYDSEYDDACIDFAGIMYEMRVSKIENLS